MSADRPSRPRAAYEVLGVAPNVSEDELRRAHRRAARAAHPDTGGSAAAFAAVAAAWEAVGTSEARARYDRSLGGPGAHAPGAASTRRDPGPTFTPRGARTSATGTDRSSGGPRPRERPVVFVPPLSTSPVPNGVLDAARSARRWHGAPRRRGLLPDDHRQLRQARVLRLLERHLLPGFPAARVLTGLSLGGRFTRSLDVDHAVLCGDRLAVLSSVQVPDGVYTWDGQVLNSGRAVAAPPVLGPAMVTLQRRLPNVTVGGLVLVMTDRDAMHTPVVRRVRGADDPEAQADLLTAPPAAGRDFLRELSLFLGTGHAPETVDRASMGALVELLY